jgi:hypothetical protein
MMLSKKKTAFLPTIESQNYHNQQLKKFANAIKNNFN